MGGVKLCLLIRAFLHHLPGSCDRFQKSFNTEYGSFESSLFELLGMYAPRHGAMPFLFLLCVKLLSLKRVEQNSVACALPGASAVLADPTSRGSIRNQRGSLFNASKGYLFVTCVCDIIFVLATMH